MDLDQFKVVNDTCGHAAGDLLLRQIASCCKRTCAAATRWRASAATSLRFFWPIARTREAIRVAELLRESIAAFRFEWRDGTMQVGVSIGIVEIDGTSESLSALMSAADVACYVAKDLGRNRIHVYEEGDAAERHQEMQWVARINRAREHERLELYYQPIVGISEDADPKAHYELLLRMRDDQGELVEPTTFIPAAERYNLMPSLDRWVVQRPFACSRVVARGRLSTCWPSMCRAPRSTMRDSSSSCSRSSTWPGSPRERFASRSPRALRSRISQSVVHFMKTLKKRGCRFSLDDFGTGLSSLTYLKNLPVDYVKIDGHFIRNVATDRADQSMVEAIAHMAGALEIKTIAERVESREVLERLRQIGVSFAQGYYIAAPRPVAEFGHRAQPRPVAGCLPRSGVV